MIVEIFRINKINKKGLILPLALLTIFLSSTFIFYASHFLMDYFQSKNISYLNELATSQANNALVYGLNSLNTPNGKGGNKCTIAWYNTKNGGEIEITNEDKSLTQFQNGLTVRRFFSLKGTTDFHNAYAHGIARVYDKDKLVAEKNLATRVDLVAEIDDGEVYNQIKSKCLSSPSSIVNSNIRNFCTKGFSSGGGWSQTEIETLFYSQLRNMVTTEINAGRQVLTENETLCVSGAMSVKKETWGVE